MNANELADGIPPALWANPKTEIHGIVDVRTYPLEGFIPLCVKQDADTMLRQQQAEIEELKLKLNTWLFLNPEKTLTDEQINELWLVTCSKAGEVDDMQLHFARAILRKAQENG